MNINTTTDTVGVTASATAPAFFAKLFGIHSTTQAASAQATWKAGAASTCTQAGSAQCSVIYAADTSCASGKGIQFGTQSQGGMTLNMTGAVHSEGVMAWQGYNVTVTASGLTVAGSCYTSRHAAEYDNIKATQVSSEPWPIDYTQSPYFTACTTTCTTVTNNAGGAGIAACRRTAPMRRRPPPGSHSATRSAVTRRSPAPCTARSVLAIRASRQLGTGRSTIAANTSSCQNDTFIGGNIVLMTPAIASTPKPTAA